MSRQSLPFSLALTLSLSVVLVSSASSLHSRANSITKRPDHWSESFPVCGGTSQSPIMLDETQMLAAEDMAPFTFYHYDEMPTAIFLENNGHSAKLTFEMGNTSYMVGGGLSSEYEFFQLHFHWGHTDDSGSEHGINQNSYPCEVHLVHYRKVYGTVMEALGYQDGLAVLSYVGNITPEDNPDLFDLLQNFGQIATPGTVVQIAPFPLSTFLPTDTTKFYRYQGSLTTPPCNEVVVWTVFQELMAVSAAQLNVFRTLEDESGYSMGNNNRPIQPLNNRQVVLAQL